MAHELTHVMQFREHGVPGGRDLVGDPGDAAELQARDGSSAQRGASGWARPTATIHRDEAEEDDFCSDLVQQMLDVIWGRNNIKRGLAERYEQMLEDPNDLFHTRPTGPNSWEGHKQQYEGLRKRLNDLLTEFFKKPCEDPQLIPDYVHDWADRPAPVRPRVKPDSPRFEAPSWEQVWEVVKVLGLGVLTVGVILAALADPEPASKLAMAGLSAVMITTILTSLGYDAPSSGGPQA